MKIVHGFLGGFPNLGVRTPELPSTGDFTSSPSSLPTSRAPDVEGSGSEGDDVDGGPSGVLALSLERSALSLSFFSFFSFRLAFSLSAFSALAAPLTFAPPEPLLDSISGGGVDVEDLLALWGRGRSGTGVGTFVGG